MKVREVLKLLEDDGWEVVRTRGSHRQLRHPTKSGTVTLAGNSGVEVPKGTLNAILKQSGLKNCDMNMRYAVIIEKGEASYGAYVPDLPGCVAAGITKDEVINLIHEAIEFHIEGLKNNGESIPEPSSSIEFIEVAA